VLKKINKFFLQLQSSQITSSNCTFPFQLARGREALSIKGVEVSKLETIEQGPGDHEKHLLLFPFFSVLAIFH
jgi:hypothetical protein